MDTNILAHQGKFVFWNISLHALLIKETGDQRTNNCDIAEENNLLETPTDIFIVERNAMP